MNFIQGGIELKYHGDEITIAAGDGTRLKLIYRAGRLLIFNERLPGKGYSLVIATPDGFYSADYDENPTAKVDTVRTWTYQG